jgi:predicted Rossmann fold nucleotide-binding protein DprA/Smf involved in DNA uptake
LITVDFALGMKKPIYGAPADMFSAHSAGLLSYMSHGKVSVLTDVQFMLDRHFQQKTSFTADVTSFSLDPLQEQIVSYCLQGEVSLDTLTVALSSDAATLLQSLTMLEIYGLIIQS